MALEYPKTLEGWAALFGIPVEKAKELVEKFAEQHPEAKINYEQVAAFIEQELGQKLVSAQLANVLGMLVAVVRAGQGPIGHSELEIGGL
jgi:hypothetical protein